MTTQLQKNPRKISKTSKSFQLQSSLRDYAVLKARIEEVLIVGRKRVEKEMMRMRYDSGLLINEHVRLNEGRAAYGSQAILKLEKDFDIDYTELNRYAQFARAYPIHGGRRELTFNLSWSCYRKLMVIPGDELRDKLTAQAEKNKWSFDEVSDKVQKVIGKTQDEKPVPRLPFVCLGPFFTYKIIRPVNIYSESKELLLDLGFKHRLEMKLFKDKFPAGAIVTGTEGSFALTQVKGATDDLLYTYKARVEEVIDADTLKVDFILGLGNRKGETIRLNHINCPEINTPEGKAAKRFVESELAGCEFITVKSTRTKKEKFGRYLGDVFYQRKNSSTLTYLNQLLLDKGHAVRFKA